MCDISEDVPVALGNAYKIVVDCGNGVPGVWRPSCIRRWVTMWSNYTTDRRTFKSHARSNPTGNLEDLIASVRDHEADIGFAFDGDGDRLGVVDGYGNIIWADRLMMLYANDILGPRLSGLRREMLHVVARGYRAPWRTPIMAKTGHSYMKNKMEETGALMAGELSGHIFFKDRWFGFETVAYVSAAAGNLDESQA